MYAIIALPLRKQTVMPMKTQTKQAMTKYLKFVYWSQYLRNQGLLSDKEYCQMLTIIRTRYDVE